MIIIMTRKRAEKKYYSNTRNESLKLIFHIKGETASVTMATFIPTGICCELMTTA